MSENDLSGSEGGAPHERPYPYSFALWALTLGANFIRCRSCRTLDYNFSA